MTIQPPRKGGIMLMQCYDASELSFAWCYRVYFRWRTYRRKPNSALATLSAETLTEILRPYGIHVLKLAADCVDLRLLVSLLPGDSVSVTASKVKGQISKWLTQQSSSGAGKHFSRGYFAATCGDSTANSVSAYLDRQAEHHGYSNRVLSPVFVDTFEESIGPNQFLSTDHTVTRLRFHIVFSTWQRRGIFDQSTAKAVCSRWLEQQAELRIVFEKVSFLPDHVHLAVRLDPSTNPEAVSLNLLNSAQEVLWNQFDVDVIRAGLERLWQPSAYLGSIGDVTSSAMSAYVSRWEGQHDL
jgi:putative transposase